MLNSTSFGLLSFIGVLCALPWLVKWVQRRTGRGLGATDNPTKLVSVLALGPQQRVVTVDVVSAAGGPSTRLVLGVTAQSITCLHAAPVLTPNTEVALIPSANNAINFEDLLQAQRHG